MEQKQRAPYPRESAGALMTTRVPIATPETTTEEAMTLLKDAAKKFDTVNYLYLVNTGGELVGVVSVKELFGADPQAKLSTLSPAALITARARTDQERVVQLALKHNIKAVPVVNAEHCFLGAVPSDVILHVLNAEHTEDLMHLAGVARELAEDDAKTVGGSTIAHVRARLPWLVLGLFGGILAALVVGFFDAILAEELILAAFIPAVVYMADAVGSQTQMVFIRSLTFQSGLKLFEQLKKEWYINSVIGLVLSALIFGVSLAWIRSLETSVILSLSIFMTVYFSMFVGVFLPWCFTRFNFDPAIASGPLATVIRDVSSLCIYLGIAQLIL